MTATFDYLTWAESAAAKRIAEERARGGPGSESTENSTVTRKPWNVTCAADLHNIPVSPRRWIVDEWLPAGEVAILYGEGGAGKSQIAQQLISSCATGLPWCGLRVEKCRAFGLFCEDDDEEMHRRQEAINNAYGIDCQQLRNLNWTSAIGEDNTLMNFDKNGRGIPTEAFHQLKDLAQGCGLVVIDSAAITFGGNENERRDVTLYIGAISKMARETGAAVIILAHPSRHGMGTSGDMDGGSTAWSNAARTRLSLEKGRTTVAGDTGERVLRRRKSNYAAPGDAITLCRQNGVLVPVSVAKPVQGAGQPADVDTVFLNLLRKFSEQKKRVSRANTACNYAPKVFAKDPDRNGVTQTQFTDAMGRALAAGTIEWRNFGRSNRPEMGLALVGAG